ncbi:TPA: DDE-type integrase/transposase/recombinase [Bacillus paranthracis]|nr:DDE-type integrase/transposase/recombinase [Bacillus paranthracis]
MNLVVGVSKGYKKEHPKIGLIIHIDQGSQYTSSTFQATLKKYGAISSVSRTGNPYDNALMEYFYKNIKRELIQGAKFRTTEQARTEIFKYIELYYNTKRMHFSLDYLSPIEFEKAYS